MKKPCSSMEWSLLRSPKSSNSGASVAGFKNLFPESPELSLAPRSPWQLTHLRPETSSNLRRSG